MNEVEKMYENAGIKPLGKCDCSKMTIRIDDKVIFKGEELTEPITMVYPPFTAEKQLELIKWLGKLDGKLELQSTYNKEKFIFNFYFNRKTSKNPDPKYPYVNLLSEDFSVLIAGLINCLWQDLTEEERKQIKEALE